MVSWDRGVEFETAYRQIVRHMNKNNKITKCYDAILLVQLRNGCRVSEAVRGFLEFLRTSKLEVEVPVSKKKKSELRLVVIPNEVVPLRSFCSELLSVDLKRLIDRVKHYCKYTYKFNTHSLRYSFITYLLRNGVNPSIVAKITRHSRLDFILKYTQEKEAEKVLREISI
jgi:Phage integrase family.